jgi:hypothetical protein
MELLAGITNQSDHNGSPWDISPLSRVQNDRLRHDKGMFAHIDQLSGVEHVFWIDHLNSITVSQEWPLAYYRHSFAPNCLIQIDRHYVIIFELSFSAQIVPFDLNRHDSKSGHRRCRKSQR